MNILRIIHRIDENLTVGQSFVVAGGIIAVSVLRYVIFG